MKHVFLILIAFSQLNMTHAEPAAEIAYQLTTNSVKCRSGKPVNFKETVAIGEVLEHVVRLPAGSTRTSQSNLQLDVFMADPARAYASGAPPCPQGDTLEIVFTARLCSYRSSANVCETFQ